MAAYDRTVNGSIKTNTLEKELTRLFLAFHALYRNEHRAINPGGLTPVAILTQGNAEDKKFTMGCTFYVALENGWDIGNKPTWESVVSQQEIAFPTDYNQMT